MPKKEVEQNFKVENGEEDNPDVLRDFENFGEDKIKVSKRNYRKEVVCIKIVEILWEVKKTIIIDLKRKEVVREKQKIVQVDKNLVLEKLKNFEIEVWKKIVVWVEEPINQNVENFMKVGV